MNRAEETFLVWSLVDVARAALSPDAQIWLCVKIGAGDQVEAINELLDVFAQHDVEIPTELSPPLWAWVSGYFGSDSEPRLRTLMAGLRMPDPLGSPDVRPDTRPTPHDERPRRVRPHFAQMASPTGAHLDAAASHISFASASYGQTM
ncbi:MULTISPECIES: hypothetical protein [unclassified Mycobacterium]|uniref:hypothetical protein n=1 Tax=unclassified Mycobacterium TaxID=2642494 RepID=UPI0029C88C9B|nr:MULTISPECIES: hypothetical protein [unclassified Mycobacterium]